MSTVIPPLSSGELTAANREGSSQFLPWLTVCVGITVLLTGASLLVGTSGIRMSLAWLLSPASSYVTGTIIEVGGGR